jgi:hypothetical protein
MLDQRDRAFSVGSRFCNQSFKYRNGSHSVDGSSRENVNGLARIEWIQDGNFYTPGRADQCN